MFLGVPKISTHNIDAYCINVAFISKALLVKFGSKERISQGLGLGYN